MWASVFMESLADHSVFILQEVLVDSCCSFCFFSALLDITAANADCVCVFVDSCCYFFIIVCSTFI